MRDARNRPSPEPIETMDDRSERLRQRLSREVQRDDGVEPTGDEGSPRGSPAAGTASMLDAPMTPDDEPASNPDEVMEVEDEAGGKAVVEAEGEELAAAMGALAVEPEPSSSSAGPVPPWRRQRSRSPMRQCDRALDQPCAIESGCPSHHAFWNMQDGAEARRGPRQPTEPPTPAQREAQSASGAPIAAREVNLPEPLVGGSEALPVFKPSIQTSLRKRKVAGVQGGACARWKKASQQTERCMSVS